MSVVRQHANERRIPGRGPGRGPLGPLGPVLTAVCALLTACAVLGGCMAGPGQPAFKLGGPLITLRVGVYADPGYQRSGLYAEYERLHPNVRIVQTGRAPQAGYWQALQAALKSGRGLDDIQAVPVADIAAVTSSLAGDFVPLNTLGGVSGGTSAFADDWLPWVARQAANRAGTTYALGAEIGPIATCYRTSLLAEAGLPTRPAVLARDWSTWSGYLRSGRLFRSRIPHGPAFTDSATSLYNAMAGQAPEQYDSPAGRLAVRGNPAIKAAWDTAVQASRGGLTAGLAPQTTAWDQGVTRGAFATVMCPAWMLHQIAALGGPLGSGGWNVTAAPGGAGNSGGFNLALPKAGRHQQAAFQLASLSTRSTSTTRTRSVSPRRRRGPITATSPAPTTRRTTRGSTFRPAGPGSTPAASRSVRPRTPSCPSAPGTSATRSGPRSRLT